MINRFGLLNLLIFYFRYTAENSVKYGALRDTDQPELRQPLALEIWTSILKTMDPGSKITVLTNGPLTSLAKIITRTNSTSFIQVRVCRIRICDYVFI